ncbi:MAG: hydrogenase maturation nickel metallochaperone HypA, partial [Pseudomonadota bacterium]|nr:hydrogenase maturation nickel metallochaperone HypA [Pseudomonadota bacterium]
RGWCMDCARSVSIATLYASCPHCGGAQVQATDGLQMRVQDLMVE